jgi:hypothetical protein
MWRASVASLTIKTVTSTREIFLELPHLFLKVAGLSHWPRNATCDRGLELSYAHAVDQSREIHSSHEALSVLVAPAQEDWTNHGISSPHTLLLRFARRWIASRIFWRVSLAMRFPFSVCEWLLT